MSCPRHLTHSLCVFFFSHIASRAPRSVSLQSCLSSSSPLGSTPLSLYQIDLPRVSTPRSHREGHVRSRDASLSFFLDVNCSAHLEKTRSRLALCLLGRVRLPTLPPEHPQKQIPLLSPCPLSVLLVFRRRHSFLPSLSRWGASTHLGQ